MNITASLAWQEIVHWIEVQELDEEVEFFLKRKTAATRACANAGTYVTRTIHLNCAKVRRTLGMEYDKHLFKVTHGSSSSQSTWLYLASTSGCACKGVSKEL